MFTGNDLDSNPVLLTEFNAPAWIKIPLAGLAAGFTAVAIVAFGFCVLSVGFVAVSQLLHPHPPLRPLDEMLQKGLGFAVACTYIGGLLLIPVSMVLLPVARSFPASSHTLMKVRLAICGGAFAFVEGGMLRDLWLVAPVFGLLTGLLFACWTRRD